jgi:O-antigen ligase
VIIFAEVIESGGTILKKKIQTKKQNIDWPVHLSLFGLIVLTPLVAIKGLYEPVMMPRLLLLGMFLAAGFLFLFLNKNFAGFSKSILQDKIVLALGIFAVWTFISQFFAINFVEGLYDTFKTFGVLMLVIFLAHLFSASNDYKSQIALYASVAAIIISAIALYQYKVHVLDNPGEALRGQLAFIYNVKATMAHKNQLSIALMLQLPFILFGLFSFKKARFLLALTALLLNVAVIVLLQTRSVMVGIFAAAMVMAALSVIRSKQLGISSLQRKLIALGLIVLLIAPPAFVLAGRSRPDSIFNKIQSTFSPDDTRNLHRVKIWDISLRMAAENPVLGVGAGNWKLAIPDYFNRVNIKIYESNWLRPHNDYIWVLAEKGIPGLLVYLSIFGLAFYHLHLLANRAKSKPDLLFVMLLGAGLTAYLAVSFFTFPYERINHQIYLAIIFAIVIAERQMGIKPEKINKPTVVVPAGILSFFIIIYAANAIRSEYFIAKAIDSGNRGQYSEMVDYSLKARTIFRNLDPENNPVAWYTGSAYIQLGDANNAVKFLRKAARQTPNNMVVLNNLGQALIMKGDFEKAFKALRRSVKIFPYYNESLVNISTAAYRLGDYEAAYFYLVSIDFKDRTAAILNNTQIVAEKIGVEKARKIKQKAMKMKREYKNYQYVPFSKANDNEKLINNEKKQN